MVLFKSKKDKWKARRASMTRKDRGCLCKRRFDSEEAAQAEIERMNIKIPLYFYRCRYGNHFHLTKRPQ